MENQIINLEPAQSKSWEENNNFIDEQKITKSVKSGIEKATDVVKETAEMVVNEAKLVAPEVVDVIKDQNQRLKNEERIIDQIPNNFLYYTLTALGLIALWKILK